LTSPPSPWPQAVSGLSISSTPWQTTRTSFPWSNSGGLSISGALTINEVSGTFTETTGYRIASYTGALGGLGRFSNDNGSGLITSGVGNTWSINYNNGGFITLTSLTAVPEPGTLGLLGVALGGFFVRRFRRRSSRDCTPGK